MRVSRRTALKAGAAASALAWSIGGRARAQDAPVRHAVIGTGGMGTNHLNGFARTEGCQIVAACDLDPERRAKVEAWWAGKFDATMYTDFHELLANPDIDSVSIATPDHWHTPVALHALLAGKHVYVEKPCSHNIHEALVLERVARETGLCVQHGTQHRSGAGPKEAVRFLREGGLGKVRMAKAINHQLRKPIGIAEEEEPPAGVDYDRWLGPAPVRPYTRNRWHYNWHWFWDYGTGDTGNDGVHQIDMMRWGMGAGLPKRVTSVGAQLFYEDDHETPDTQTVIFEYDGMHLMYEMRLWTDYKMEGHDNGVLFYGDKGRLEVGREGCFVSLIGEPEKRRLGDSHDFSENVRNFVACVKAGAPERLNAPISEGAISTILCHLANIGTRVERPLTLGENGAQAVGDEAASALFTRTYREAYELPNA
ncbi:MAG: Gfo/Idh/MocA family oxidoreductase [Candidatus Hydrogenedentes bacterium]|nr:Gfo/Idh/MocA family oxidoreductase [Candidatus Hydrogenedentota bacterium]